MKFGARDSAAGHAIGEEGAWKCQETGRDWTGLKRCARMDIIGGADGVDQDS